MRSEMGTTESGEGTQMERENEISDGLRAELEYHREVNDEQSNHLGRLEIPALILAGLLLSPIIAVAVVSSHIKTKRDIRRARLPAKSGKPNQ